MRTEIWNNHPIRFVEVSGEWWAVLMDVCDALKLLNPTMVAKRIGYDELTKFNLGGQQGETLIVNEFGIYQTIFQSRKPEAKDFQKWTYSMLKELRQASGLAGFEIFRMMDKGIQKDAMQRLRDGLKKPVRVDFIKANCIANKAVSSRYGYQNMVKKADMTPQMLVDRQAALDATVELMTMKERYGLDLSVSEIVYERCSHQSA